MGEGMEIGGLMAEAFRLFLGNPDISVFLVTFTLFLSLVVSMILVRSHFDDEL